MKRILIVLIGLVFLLAACNGNTEANTNETTENNNEEEIEKESENINEEKEEKNKKENKKNNKETKQKNDYNEEEKDEVEPLYSINEEIWSLEPLKEETNSKVVLLTIDDAPDSHALEMAETLEALNVNAIFFVNGHFLETDEEKETLKK